MPVCVGETRHSGTSSQWLPRCSVIIPVHNRASLTRQCLNALLEGHLESTDFEIIVVDDASTDSTQQLLTDYRERVRVVTHARNSGFAAACNDGVAAASGEYLVFLNNDTTPNAGWLDALVRYAESHPDAAVVGSKLLFPNNMIQHAGVVVCQDLYPRHLYAGFPSVHPAVNKSRRFQAVTAACMLVRREPFEQVGGFDTAFRNGLEDVDLCLRLGERGSEVHYCHESALYHLESLSGGWSGNEKENARLYRSRWAHRVQPDDFHYYLEDGLLKVSYAHTWSYPIHLSVSPLLAVMDEDEHERQADRLLNARSRQVFDLLRETIHLTLHAREAELRTVTEEQTALQPPTREHAEKKDATGPHPVVAEQAGYPEAPAAAIEAMPSDEAELKAMLLDAHEQLLRRDQEIESLLYNLQTVSAAEPGQGVSDAPTAASATDQGFAPNKYLGYQQLVRRIREVVRATLPADATVIVASKGDNELLQLDVRQVWHFPQNEDGAYAGYYPADSAAAIHHLEELRSKGGGFLLFPSTALWWLDHYDEFREHLEQRYQVLVREEDACVIFALQAANRGASSQSAELQPHVRQVLEVARSVLPEDAVVIVANRGDEELLKLDGLRAWGFPLIESPCSTDFDLAERTNLIDQLETLRTNGADFLIVPSGAYSWLEQQRELRQHLERRYRTVIHQKHVCWIVTLRGTSPGWSQASDDHQNTSNPHEANQRHDNTEKMLPSGSRRVGGDAE